MIYHFILIVRIPRAATTIQDYDKFPPVFSNEFPHFGRHAVRVLFGKNLRLFMLAYRPQEAVE